MKNFSVSRFHYSKTLFALLLPALLGLLLNACNKTPDDIGNDLTKLSASEQVDHVTAEMGDKNLLYAEAFKQTLQDLKDKKISLSDMKAPAKDRMEDCCIIYGASFVSFDPNFPDNLSVKFKTPMNPYYGLSVAVVDLQTFQIVASMSYDCVALSKQCTDRGVNIGFPVCALEPNTTYGILARLTSGCPSSVCAVYSGQSTTSAFVDPCP